MANRWIDKGPAKRPDDVVVFVKSPRYRKPPKDKKHKESRRIHQVIEKLRRATVAQISQMSKCSVERVREHVNFHVENGHHVEVERATHAVAGQQLPNGKLPHQPNGAPPAMPKAIDIDEPPKRIKSTVNRICRDTRQARQVK